MDSLSSCATCAFGLLNTPGRTFGQLLSCSKQEEVNELAVHPKGDYLAAADDSGVVKVYNTRTRMVEKTLRNAHTVCRSFYPYVAAE